MAKVSLRAYNREIEAMIDRSHLDEAVAHCQHILKTFPKHLETYRLLGKAYLEAKRHTEAVDVFSRVLAAEPNDFVAQVGMSIIRDEENKLDDAIWHMERAFEAHSANPAIQGELQRLYGRRDGVQPPRIRMTRGALAHMYMRGELYPQAISESKIVLQEDQGRSDMQALLSKAYYRSGQKNDAADAASSVLKRYPYCFDANCVLTEVLGSDRPESAQVYRQRVIELDPYAAQVDGTVFQANDVSDAAVMIEHLDWNGQSAGRPSDLGAAGGISLESGSRNREAQPDWLKNAFPESTSTPPSALSFASEQDAFSSPQTLPPAQPADDIPDFLRAAGWGESTGTPDESQSPSAMFDDGAASAVEPIAQGDLPDWVKAMAPPQETLQPAQESEEMPDWINKIGTGGLPIPSAGSIPGDDGDDWLKQLGDDDSISQSQASADQLDWMKGFGGEEQSAAPVSEDQRDWMKGIEQEEQPVTASDKQPDWMKGFGDEEEPVPSQSSSDFDFLNELTNEPEQPAPSQTPVRTMDTGDLGRSDAERDDSFAWLENLAVKQGATEGLLTKPEERLEDEPDWIKQAKGLNEPAKPPIQQPPTPVPPSTPSANVEELGRSDAERDDSFAWLENLAAKQGATEGLLTKPEERMEQEPDWVKKVKSSGNAQQPPVQQAQIEQPAEELSVPAPVVDTGAPGTSEEELDDSFAWLENLAAEQGATEGLLTRPEERLEDESDWVTQLESAPTAPSMQTPAPEEITPTDDVASWLKGLDDEEETQEPAPVAEDDTDSWLKSLEEPEELPITSASASDDLPAWMQDIEGKESLATESAVPLKEAESSDWMSAVEEPVVESPAPVQESEDVSGWLSSLENEETQPPIIPASDDLPAWMRDDTGEAVAEPTRIEPTRPADWKPVDDVQAEAVEPPPPAPQPAPAPEPEPSFVSAQDKPAPEPRKKPAPRKTGVKPATPPGTYKEPVTRKGAGMLDMVVDPILGSARSELTRSNIPGALETYGKLIKKGRFLDEAIYDLREALYRYPVEVSIWQTLGDAYMRANRLQDALDAYTKAEELLR